MRQEERDIYEQNLFCKNPVFECNGEKLPLDQIKDRKVRSIKLTYLSELKTVKAPGIAGFFGKTVSHQEKMEVELEDENGLFIDFNPEEVVVVVRFSKPSEWTKIKDYDEGTLLKRYLMTIVNPYLIQFHVGNLKNVTWK